MVKPDPDAATLDANYPLALPRQTRYERRPAQMETAQMPITVSALYGAATTIACAAVVMLARVDMRFLWIAALVGAAVFLLALTWRLQVQDEMNVIERETTIENAPAAIRPVVESARGNLIRRGNFAMERRYWQRLYEMFSDGRRVTRDEVVRAEAMPRELYHARFDETTAEMRRVGLLDDDNRMTAAWRKFHHDWVSVRPFVRSTGANEDNGGNGVGGSM